MLRKESEDYLTYIILKDDVKIVKDTIEWEGFKKDAPFRVSSFKKTSAFKATLNILKWDNCSTLRRELDANFDAFECEGKYYLFFDGKWHWVTFINKVNTYEVDATSRMFKQYREHANA